METNFRFYPSRFHRLVRHVSINSVYVCVCVSMYDLVNSVDQSRIESNQMKEEEEERNPTYERDGE